MRTYVYTALLAAITGAALTYYLYPRYVTKTETKARTEVRNDIRTITKIVTRPDGTKEVTKDTTDNSVKTIDASKLVVVNKPNYLVGFTAGTRTRLWEPIYGAHGSIRVLGPVFIGIYGRTDREFGAVVTVEF